MTINQQIKCECGNHEVHYSKRYKAFLCWDCYAKERRADALREAAREAERDINELRRYGL